MGVGLAVRSAVSKDKTFQCAASEGVSLRLPSPGKVPSEHGAAHWSLAPPGPGVLLIGSSPSQLLIGDPIVDVCSR